MKYRYVLAILPILAALTATAGAAPAAGERNVDFTNEVLPLLTRYGCNAGGCHGKQSGQNGFKLSLLGYDPKYDYEQIARNARGRRVFPASPDDSLLLLKATGRVPHGGGVKIKPDSAAYKLIRRWIEQGVPASSPNAPKVVKVTVEPAEGFFRKGTTQQLAVTAQYSDGTTRDVTAEAQFASNLDPVAAADEDGLVRGGGDSGEAAVMVRYMNRVAVFRAIAPHGKPMKELPAGSFTERNYVDALAAAKWKKLGLVPSPPCDDATYLRRVTVDLAGRLPTGDEARAFLADESPGKRDALVDRLLNSPDYAAYFAMKWSTLLRNRGDGEGTAAYAFHNWIKEQIATNAPYDQFVRGIVAASGEWQEAPPVAWHWQMFQNQAHEATSNTAQLFLGLQIQCAQCHHHPYERWGQDDYYGLAGFFTRLARKEGPPPQAYFNSATIVSPIKDPMTLDSPKPKYLGGEVVTVPAEKDPRHALVDWMVAKDNPYFARALANRTWGHFMGRGLVDPVDDMRATNPPSNPELLDALAKDFTDSGYDVKRLIRTIVTSGTYQLSSEPTERNKNDRQNFARFYARRFVAEVMVDAVDYACGLQSDWQDMPRGSRAVDLPHNGNSNEFLEVFGRPRRVTPCECERPRDVTLEQVLLLMNSDHINVSVQLRESNVIHTMVKQKKATDEQVIEELYLRGLGRYPTKGEWARLLAYVKEGQTPEDRQYQNRRLNNLQDVLWSIINMREFSYNH